MENINNIENIKDKEFVMDLFDIIMADFEKDPNYEVEIMNSDEIVIKKRK